MMLNTRVCIVFGALLPLALTLNGNLLSNFTVSLVKTQQAVVLGCDVQGLVKAGRALITWNQPILLLQLKKNVSLADALTRKNRAKTSVILDCSCSESIDILQLSSERKYFNKTYQWMIWDPKNIGLNKLLRNLTNIGPNAQMTYVNMTTNDTSYSLFDVHSKGRHLNAPLEVVHYADWQDKLLIFKNILDLQGVRHRDQFNLLQIRGATVVCYDNWAFRQIFMSIFHQIDRDNITRNDQIKKLLSSPIKEYGVAPFIKYHFELLKILEERLNFTVNYRNSRGWAGRLGGGTFRLGLLGIVMRNEVEIAVSGAFNRINRFAEFDTIHQSWKFEGAFLYRFTSDVDAHSGSGNFLAPFASQVWLFSCVTIFVVIIMWRSVAWLKEKQISDALEGEDERENLILKSLAAVCQQGIDPIPRSLPSRTIIFTLFVFSLVMYNYYTSSVVGGLLSSTGQGPKTIADIVNSPLTLAFEDIGYYKVLFKDSKSPLIQRMYRTKVLPERTADELKVFTSMKEALPYLKKGGYAFHCELVDAYPEIARIFDDNEICDLRIVQGLLETEVLNWIVPKNSMYTELFRIMMVRVRETGILARTLTIFRPKQPQCQSGATVYPVAFSGVNNAFALLGVGMLTAVVALVGEILRHRIRGSLRISECSRR